MRKAIFKTNNTIYLVITGILLFLSHLTVEAQSFNVLQITPENQSLVDFVEVPIQVSFNQPIRSSSIESSVRVYGEWTGSKDFDFQLDNNNRDLLIRINSDSDFLNAGEKITLNISNSLKSNSGIKLNNGYISQYFYKTQPGTLIQTQKEKIQLKQTGESWLNTNSAYPGDMDNDGYTDLTLVNGISSDLRILMNNRDGSFDNKGIIKFKGTEKAAGQTADFDYDGKIDFAFGSADNQELSVLLGDGWGGFSKQKNLAEGHVTKGLAVLDFDGDGDEDIVLTNQEKNQLSLYTNTGKGNFSFRSQELDASEPTAVEAADANNDGILDLFIGFFGSKKIGILLGDGKGGFDISDEVTVMGSPWMLAVADLNGDNFADVASVNSKGNVIAVILCDGTGGLGSPKAYALANALEPKAIDLGDLDGDGDLDMVTANHGSNNFVVWENNATGVMSKAAILKGSKNPSYVVLSDRDNDGDLDITGTDGTTDEVILFENVPNSRMLNEDISGIISAEISPNPFRNRLKIKAYIPRTGRTDVRIVDASGRTLEMLWDARLDSGEHYFGWDGRTKSGSAPAGIYFVSITQNGKTFTWPINKI